MTQAAKALCKWTPFLKKLGNAEPWGIKIQKKHRFSYTGKSIFVTVTEATRTPDFNGEFWFSAVSEATQAPWPFFCARIGVAIRLFCTFFFAKAPGGYANSGTRKGKFCTPNPRRKPSILRRARLCPAWPGRATQAERDPSLFLTRRSS